MFKKGSRYLLLALMITVGVFADVPNVKASDAVDKTRKIVDELVDASYHMLKNEKIDIEEFQSKSDYFRSNFSLSRYATFRKMRYVIQVNPEVFMKNAPEEGVRSILAHELEHIVYYRGKNRGELLGLGNLLTDKSFTAKFERKADLGAIGRGYGIGLRMYRDWLYLNIPSDKMDEKKRNYFSPEEIDLILSVMKNKPDVLQYWRENVPRNINDIRKQA